MMVNEERTKLMARAELFKKKESRRSLYINHFFRSDYIGYKMIRAGIFFALAYWMVVIMWAIYHAEELMTEREISELASMGINAVIVMVCLLACFLVIAYFVFSRKYKKARDKTKDYQITLKKINNMYEHTDGRDNG